MPTRIEQDGKTYEFRGEYRVPKQDDFYLPTAGSKFYRDAEVAYGWGTDEPRAILHLIPEILEFGGIKFVKTGEVRTPAIGEWFLSRWLNSIPVYCNAPFIIPDFSAPILKPYSVVVKEPSYT